MHSRAHTAEMIRGLTGKLLPSSPDYPHQHVFSTELSPAPDDPGETRILDLCDGRHVDDLKEAVFRQLASSGSGAGHRVVEDCLRKGVERDPGQSGEQRIHPVRITSRPCRSPSCAARL